MVQKRYLFPPSPSENDIFSPLTTHRFLTPWWPLCLNSSLFCIILPFYLPFSHFLSPFFRFLKYIFPLFLFAFSYFFPQMTLADIPPPQGGYFSIYRPLQTSIKNYVKYVDNKNPLTFYSDTHQSTFRSPFLYTINFQITNFQVALEKEKA